MPQFTPTQHNNKEDVAYPYNGIQFKNIKKDGGLLLHLP
jgi:hypothetical protein